MHSIFNSNKQRRKRTTAYYVHWLECHLGIHFICLHIRLAKTSKHELLRAKYYFNIK